MKQFFCLFIFLMVLPGCTPANTTGQMDEKSALTSESVKETFGPRCELVSQCNDMAYIDCMSAADGPSYYVDSQSMEVLGKCGGFCMIVPEEGSDSCQQCPPESWTCK
tara:strand:+ start:204 stop:527 length:324 start_codon:yes stop_codon:yes gene_type:complete